MDTCCSVQALLANGRALYFKIRRHAGDCRSDRVLFYIIILLLHARHLKKGECK